jgi:hypothetical protein
MTTVTGVDGNMAKRNIVRTPPSSSVFKEIRIESRNLLGYPLPNTPSNFGKISAVFKRNPIPTGVVVSSGVRLNSRQLAGNMSVKFIKTL